MDLKNRKKNTGEIFHNEKRTEKRVEGRNSERWTERKEEEREEGGEQRKDVCWMNDLKIILVEYFSMEKTHSLIINDN